MSKTIIQCERCLKKVFDDDIHTCTPTAGWLNLEQQLSVANARIAMMKETIRLHRMGIDAVYGLLSTAPESLSAWEEAKLLPLQRQVVMQSKCIELFFQCFDILTDGPDESDEAQALQYLQEARELRSKLRSDTQINDNNKALSDGEK